MKALSALAAFALLSGSALAASPEPPGGAAACSGCHATNSAVETPVPKIKGRTADEIVAAALDAFHPDIALACSFQQEEAVLLDMVFTVRPDARVFALDTGFLFPETYDTWKAYETRYGMTIEAFRGPSPEDQAAEFGARLWETDPNRC